MGCRMGSLCSEERRLLALGAKRASISPAGWTDRALNSRVRLVVHPGNRLCAGRLLKQSELVTAAFCFGLASHLATGANPEGAAYFE